MRSVLCNHYFTSIGTTGGSTPGLILSQAVCELFLSFLAGFVGSVSKDCFDGYDYPKQLVQCNLAPHLYANELVNHNTSK